MPTPFSPPPATVAPADRGSGSPGVTSCPNSPPSTPGLPARGASRRLEPEPGPCRHNRSQCRSHSPGRPSPASHDPINSRCSKLDSTYAILYSPGCETTGRSVVDTLPEVGGVDILEALRSQPD